MKRDEIERLAVELGAKIGAIMSWRYRRVPPKWRARLIEEAKRRGRRIKESDFNGGAK